MSITTKPERMDIGSVIKELRKGKGLSQTDFADSIGITQTALSQIETGLARPNPGTLKSICKKLKVSESLLFLMAIDEKDVPEEKRELFSQLFPNIKNVMINILSEKQV